jgi:hypothetical protein
LRRAAARVGAPRPFAGAFGAGRPARCFARLGWALAAFFFGAARAALAGFPAPCFFAGLVAFFAAGRAAIGAGFATVRAAGLGAGFAAAGLGAGFAAAGLGAGFAAAGMGAGFAAAGMGAGFAATGLGVGAGWLAGWLATGAAAGGAVGTDRETFSVRSSKWPALHQEANAAEVSNIRASEGSEARL